MLPDSDVLAQATESGSSASRRKVLLILFGVLLICNLPICVWWLFLEWRAPALAKVVYEVGVVLYVVLPVLAARWWPRVTGFEIRWLPARRTDWLLTILLLVVAVAWMGLSGRFIRWMGWQWWMPGFLEANWGPAAKALFCFTTVIIVPIAEEFLYRGYVLDQLAKVTKGYLAVIIQAVLFALAHLPGHAAGSISILGFGLVLGFWRLRKRSLLPLIIVHVLFNAGFAIPPYLAQRDMFRTAQNQPEVGVPAIAKHLDDDKEATRLMATQVLMDTYGKAGWRQYAVILRTGSERQIDAILLVIDMSRCRDLVPDVRRVVYEHPSVNVQISALVTLEGLGDAEGLKEIARDHPVDRVRRAASMMLRYKTRAGEKSPAAGKDPSAP